MRTVDLSGLHVLVVEDDADSRQMLGTYLEYCGAIVSTCQSTESALEDLREYRPHVIVSDLALPGADGLHFMRTLRALPAERGGDIPAIAVTAYRRDFPAESATTAGYKGYLPKPISLEALVRLVRDLAV